MIGRLGCAAARIFASAQVEGFQFFHYFDNYFCGFCGVFYLMGLREVYHMIIQIFDILLFFFINYRNDMLVKIMTEGAQNIGTREA